MGTKCSREDTLRTQRVQENYDDDDTKFSRFDMRRVSKATPCCATQKLVRPLFVMQQKLVRPLFVMQHKS